MPCTRTLIVAAGIAAFAAHADAQTAFLWITPGSGIWSDAGNWDPAGVPGAGSPGDTATIGFAGSYLVTADTSQTVAGLHNLAIVAIRSGVTLTVNGPVSGSGTLVINDQTSTSVTTLNLGEGAVLTSPVRLNAQIGSNSRARISGQGAGATLNANILGTGRFIGVLHNDGVIGTELPGDEILVATDALLTSTGELRAVDGGTLDISSGLDGGTLHADADSRVLSGTAGVANASITGEVVIASGHSLSLRPGNSYAGSIIVHDRSSTSLTTLNLTEGAALGGSVLLNAPAGSDSRARITGQGASATLDASISGVGRLLGQLHNTGIIIADQPNGQILVATDAPLSSTGELRAVDGGTLNISSGLDGGTLHADADSRLLGGSAGVSNATLTGAAVISAGDTLTLGTGNTYNGSITVNDQSITSTTNLNISSGGSLGGTVLLNAHPGSDTRARISGLGTGATTDADISGNGRLLGILHNTGAVSANQPGGQILVATNAPLTSTGQVRAINGGTLSLSSGLDGGTLHADADSRLLGGAAGVSNATLTGTAVISAGDTLTLGTGNTYNGSIVLNDQSITSTTNLNLAEGASLGGSVLLNAPAGSDTRARITGLGTGATTDADISGTGRLLGILHNTGAVSADQPGGQIFVQTNAPLTSTGELRAVNGGTLDLSSGLDGGTLHADEDSRVRSGTAGVANATLTGTAVVAAGDSLYLLPGNTYNGSIVLNDQSITSTSSLILPDSTTLGGEIVLNSTPGNVSRARIVGPGSGDPAGIEPDAVIRGQGRLQGLINPFLGTLSPGSADLRGEINLFTTEPIVLDPGSQSVFTIGATGAGGYDFVSVSGGLELGGTLVLHIEDGVTPQFGDRWDIVQGGTITGFYDAYDLPDAPPGLAYRVVIQPSGVFVRLTCAADFDGDLTLNFFDLSSFLTAYNNQDPRADFAAPFGELNFFDIAAFIALFNQGCQP
ncbi:MAG: hypothetical protein LAT64_05360 [Phycisphaerales bacterium]|nr:hypothetical protein [Planctomycetota bacterium]MCH8508183.1 hypothetical protein [Phycisphaerales bacterium]